MRLGEVEVGGHAQGNARDISACIVLVALFAGVPLAVGVHSLPGLLVLCLGPLLVNGTFAAQLAGYRDIDRWRVFLFGLVVGVVAVVTLVVLVATGSTVAGMFGYGFALLAGVAAVLS